MLEKKESELAVLRASVEEKTIDLEEKEKALIMSKVLLYISTSTFLSVVF